MFPKLNSSHFRIQALSLSLSDSLFLFVGVCIWESVCVPCFAAVSWNLGSYATLWQTQWLFVARTSARCSRKLRKCNAPSATHPTLFHGSSPKHAGLIQPTAFEVHTSSQDAWWTQGLPSFALFYLLLHFCLFGFLKDEEKSNLNAKNQIFMALFLLYKQKTPKENKYRYPLTVNFRRGL